MLLLLLLLLSTLLPYATQRDYCGVRHATDKERR